MKCSRYSVGDTTSVDGLHDSCSVCLDEFMSGDVIRTLPCTHPFHKDCVDKWLYKKHTCPLCKFDILKGEHEDTSEDTAPEMLETNQEETVTTTTSTTSTITTLNVREGGRPDSAEHEDIQVSISSDELLVPLIGKDDVKSV
ncbi:E3 ubiquitin-protein ligase [Oopsacas minuta]|uniref:E3 ubiquitin-protein ligase n=1 Tax=Oopsacas minuta TaxID=111878 RepID=A0AAV7K9D6_9METZ|nr:E3 ubiquitin-protein ligase [Oopsacas minuta]